MTDPTNPNLSAPSGSDLGEGVVERAIAAIKRAHVEAFRPNVVHDLSDRLAEAYARAALSTPSSTLTPDADEDDPGIQTFDQSEGEAWVRTYRATPAIRDQAFEEAARLCRQYRDDAGGSAIYQQACEHLEEAIRALKGTPPTGEVP